MSLRYIFFINGNWFPDEDPEFTGKVFNLIFEDIKQKDRSKCIRVWFIIKGYYR